MKIYKMVVEVFYRNNIEEWKTSDLNNKNY